MSMLLIALLLSPSHPPPTFALLAFRETTRAIAATNYTVVRTTYIGYGVVYAMKKVSGHLNRT